MLTERGISIEFDFLMNWGEVVVLSTVEGIVRYGVIDRCEYGPKWGSITSLIGKLRYV